MEVVAFHSRKNVSFWEGKKMDIFFPLNLTFEQLLEF